MMVRFLFRGALALVGIGVLMLLTTGSKTSLGQLSALRNASSTIAWKQGEAVEQTRISLKHVHSFFKEGLSQKYSEQDIGPTTTQLLSGSVASGFFWP